MPHVRLVQEVAELQNHLGRLHSKLAEAEEALKMLANTKRELKEDLTVKVMIMMMIINYDDNDDNDDCDLPAKAVSLVIDRQKCMAMRLNFPYHTR